MQLNAQEHNALPRPVHRFKRELKRELKKELIREHNREL